MLVTGLFLMICSPLSVFAQQKATLRVLVNSEEKGTPVVGAQVMLLNYNAKGKAEKIQYGGVTNNDGLHEFGGVRPGHYQLKVSFLGYKTFTKPITLQPGKLVIKKVSLANSVSRLDEIVVQSKRKVTTGEAGVNKISSEDLGHIPTPGSGGDLASYIQTLPGVVTTGDRGGNFHIRGGTPTQNKVLVDNLPITKPFHISSLFSAFPQSSIKNVDLYAGGFSARYLGSTSAIIDVNLKPGNMRSFEGKVSVSSYLTSIEVEGPVVKDHQSFMLMGRKSVINQTNSFFPGDEGGINFYDATARYSYQGNNYTCNVTGIHTFDEGQINPNRNLTLSWTNTAIGARCLGYDDVYKHPIELTIGYSNYRNSERTLNTTERTAGRSQLFARLRHKQDVFNIPVHYGFGLNFSTYSATLAERFTSVESFNEENPIFTVFVSTEWDPNNYFSVMPSVGSQASLLTRPTFEPRLRLAYQPDGTDKQELSLAVGKYYQLFSGITDQRDAGTAFTVLKPNTGKQDMQRAIHGILGYQRNIGRSFSANVEGYFKDFKGISVAKWTPVAKVNTKTALADGLAYGFDVRLEFHRNPVYFFLGYGWSYVKYEASSDDLGAWINEPIFSYHPAYDQRHKLNTVASYRFAGFTATASWEFSSGQPYTQIYGFDLGLNIPTESPLKNAGTARIFYDRPYGKRLPVYHRLDLALARSFKLSPELRMDVKLGVINVYNRKNIFYFDVSALQRVNQLPRMPYLSIRTHIN